MLRKTLRCEIPGEAGITGEDYHMKCGTAEEDPKNTINKEDRRTLQSGSCLFAFAASRDAFIMSLKRPWDAAIGGPATIAACVAGRM